MDSKWHSYSKFLVRAMTHKLNSHHHVAAWWIAHPYSFLLDCIRNAWLNKLWILWWSENKNLGRCVECCQTKLANNFTVCGCRRHCRSRERGKARPTQETLHRSTKFPPAAAAPLFPSDTLPHYAIGWADGRGTNKVEFPYNWQFALLAWCDVFAHLP